MKIQVEFTFDHKNEYHAMARLIALLDCEFRSSGEISYGRQVIDYGPIGSITITMPPPPENAA